LALARYESQQAAAEAEAVIVALIRAVHLVRK
jgi:hypothetical protein